MQPMVREFLTKLRKEAFLEIKSEYVDTGAAAGKDTSWVDPAQLKPETIDEGRWLPAKSKHKRLLWWFRFPGLTPGSTSRLNSQFMKSPYVSDLKPNQVITTTFLVHVKDVRQKKTGEPYLSLLLGDRTGDMDAKMWDNVAEVMDTFERDDFVKVKGLLQIFQNRPQLTIHKMARVLDAEVDFADYFPASATRSARRCSPSCAALSPASAIRTCARCWKRSWTTNRWRACIAPRRPPSSVHHAFLGGLIEHVLSLCKLAANDGRALSVHRSRSVAHRRDSARHGQDGGADL